VALLIVGRRDSVVIGALLRGNGVDPRRRAQRRQAFGQPFIRFLRPAPAGLGVDLVAAMLALGLGQQGQVLGRAVARAAAGRLNRAGGRDCRVGRRGEAREPGWMAPRSAVAPMFAPMRSRRTCGTAASVRPRRPGCCRQASRCSRRDYASPASTGSPGAPAGPGWSRSESACERSFGASAPRECLFRPDPSRAHITAKIGRPKKKPPARRTALLGR
jgi:hypothetical protein